MADIEGRNHYELLGLEPGATTEAIKEAYREIARIYHPDSNFYDDIIADAGPDDSVVFKAITAAYQTLVNEEKRKVYDETLPKGLDEWDSGDGMRSSYAVYESPEDSTEDEEEIPEDWKKEREYFAENFEEILKPGPRANLVAGANQSSSERPDKDGTDPYDTWGEGQSEVQAGTRFGDISDSSGLLLSGAIPATRRGQDLPLVRDPMQLIVYVGIPFMTLVVLAEIFLLR